METWRVTEEIEKVPAQIYTAAEADAATLLLLIKVKHLSFAAIIAFWNKVADYELC